MSGSRCLSSLITGINTFSRGSDAGQVVKCHSDTAATHRDVALSMCMDLSAPCFTYAYLCQRGRRGLQPCVTRVLLGSSLFPDSEQYYEWAVLSSQPRLSRKFSRSGHTNTRTGEVRFKVDPPRQIRGTSHGTRRSRSSYSIPVRVVKLST